MRLLVDSKLTFKNPYVVRISLISDEDRVHEFFKIKKKIYNTTCGSWGYSQVIYEPSAVLSSNMFVVYIAFEDLIDATRFMLSTDNAKRVFMWPSGCRFTIHEFV